MPSSTGTTRELAPPDFLKTTGHHDDVVVDAEARSLMTEADMNAQAIGRGGRTRRHMRGWRTSPCRNGQVAFVDAYVASVAEPGFADSRRPARSRARVLCGLVGDPEDWRAMALDQRLGMHEELRRLVSRVSLAARAPSGESRTHLAQRYHAVQGEPRPTLLHRG